MRTNRFWFYNVIVGQAIAVAFGGAVAIFKIRILSTLKYSGSCTLSVDRWKSPYPALYHLVQIFFINMFIMTKKLVIIIINEQCHKAAQDCKYKAGKNSLLLGFKSSE